MTDQLPAAAATLRDLRTRAPLVHNITNLVVTNTTANALLAIGASPAMVEGVEEVEELAAAADALVLNLGTMTSMRAEAMRLAASAAKRAGKPFIVDPVAAGVLRFRTTLAHDLLAIGPAAIRGNASEILALGGAAQAGRGVDSTAAAEAAVDAARALARATGAAVAVTGETDYATDGETVLAVRNGHPLMTRVTGLGCTATALCGACLAVAPSPLLALAHGLLFLGVAGEIAARRARGPGSLQIEILDALHALDAETLTREGRLARVN